MEQTTQQITQKPPSIIKTKIATWLLIIICAIGLYFFAQFVGTSFGLYFYLFLISFIISILLLLTRKKWIWWFNILLVIFLIIPFGVWGIIMIFVFSRSPSFFGFLIPLGLLFILISFALLLIDRKNFFKIAS